MSGLEILQATLRGELPRAPIDRLMGIHLLEVETGRVVFAMPASGWLSQEYGAVFGGAIALLGCRPPPLSRRRPSAAPTLPPSA
jgi:acyl-coenzyme A thioesterase PaaI-like protein